MAVQAATRAGVATFVATSNSPAAEGFSEETGAPMPDDPHAATRAEVTAWFFEDYLPRWVAVAAGTSAEGPEFILNYWDTPMHVTGLDQSFWCLDDRSVLDFLDSTTPRYASRGTATPLFRTAGSSCTAPSGPRSRSSGHAGAPTKAKSSAGPCISSWPNPSTGGAPSAFNRPSPQATAWKLSWPRESTVVETSHG